jgi:hypothetical protein
VEQGTTGRSTPATLSESYDVLALFSHLSSAGSIERRRGGNIMEKTVVENDPQIDDPDSALVTVSVGVSF